ncbi:MAG: crossover junction endodeoxyribonuclease RuvC [Planctomycetota bacterium]
MYVVGVDPGTRIVGYGIVDMSRGKLTLVTCGVIDVRKKTNLPERLCKVFKKLTQILEKYKPDCVVVEKTFFAKNPDSAIKMGAGRGVALLAAALQNIPVSEYSATMIKKSVTGTGSAHKSQVQNMVKVILGLKNVLKSTDVSDALSCAICHCHRIGLLKSEEDSHSNIQCKAKLKSWRQAEQFVRGKGWIK